MSCYCFKYIFSFIITGFSKLSSQAFIKLWLVFS